MSPPKPTVPMSPECCGMTRLFHSASQRNLATFLTSISCSFGLQPLPTESPLSFTSPGCSWLMKHKHLTAREHREGNRELWGSGMWVREGPFSSIHLLSSSICPCSSKIRCMSFFYFYSHKEDFKVCLANFLLISILSMPKWSI